MKLSAGQLNNIRFVSPKNITRSGEYRREPSKINDSINFRGNLATILFKKVNGNIEVSNAQKLISSLDNLMGEEHFTKTLQKAGIDSTGDTLKIKNRTFLRDDFGKTLLSPVKEFIPSFANRVCDAFGIVLKDDSWVKKTLKQKEQDEARDLILDILEEFSNRKFDENLEFEKYFSKFKDNISSNITKTKKNYATRDERTLNRIVTSIVSAFYSSWDFFNISMLEKDDESEAKKAGSGKMKQDLTRMGFNAGLTFIGLGMFNRYTKRNVVLNSLVIAGSALVAEILSRVLTGNPLKPITPEEAKMIAEARKAKKAQKEQAKKEELQNNNNKNIQFKSNLKNSNELFSNFVNKNSALLNLTTQIANEVNNTPQTTQVQITNKIQTKEEPKKEAQIQEQEPKKKWGLTKVLSLAFSGATAVFFGMKFLKGDYKALKAQKEFLTSFKDNLTSAEAIKKAAEISEAHEKATKKASFMTNFKKLLTQKNVEVDVNELTKELEKLKGTTEGKQIEGLLETYIKNAQSCKTQDFVKNGKFNHKTDRFIISGFVEGFTKIFKTIYDILTIPAKGISAIVDTYLTDNSKTTKDFKKVIKEIKSKDPEKYKDELSELSQLIKSKKSDSKLVDTIKKRARNVETSAETGELANISRTMVTAIGTYFFVNDYRNKVLIESEGKNVQGAKEEMNERIWHKVFNFIINGTLMNIFNTTFKATFNGSLMGAAGIATATEITNEFLVRKSICQPILPQKSKQDIINFENEQINKDGFWGAWSRTFKQITGKKSLTEKTGIKVKEAKTAPQEKQPQDVVQHKKLEAHQG